MNGSTKYFFRTVAKVGAFLGFAYLLILIPLQIDTETNNASNMPSHMELVLGRVRLLGVNKANISTHNVSIGTYALHDSLTIGRESNDRQFVHTQNINNKPQESEIVDGGSNGRQYITTVASNIDTNSIQEAETTSQRNEAQGISSDVEQNTNSHFYKNITFLENYKCPCWHSNNGTLRCLPYFFLAGMPKCGTTDLYYNLNRHPSIEKVWKEPHWWTRQRFNKEKWSNNIAPLYEYFSKFSQAVDSINSHTLNTGEVSGSVKYHHHIFGDASASTFWDSRNLARAAIEHGTNISINLTTTADVIHHTLPNAKIIVIFRNPTSRLYSGYLYFTQINKSAQNFHEKVHHSLKDMAECMRKYNNYRTCVYITSNAQLKDRVRLHVGMYAIFLQDWLRLYRREQIMVIRLEDYTLNRTNYLKNIAKFLDIEPYPSSILQEIDEETSVRNQRIKSDTQFGDMFNETRHLLNIFYQPFNNKLAELLDDKRFMWNDD